MDSDTEPKPSSLGYPDTALKISLSDEVEVSGNQVVDPRTRVPMLSAMSR